MMALVSLEFVKSALRVDHDADDVALQGYTDAVSQRVIRYLKDAADPDWDDETTPAAIKVAVTMGVDALYSPDRVDLLAGLSTGDPRNPIVALLYDLRRPTIA